MPSNRLEESRTPEGLTQSRYPDFVPQYIPEFSLFWIGMMHDLWWYHGDVDFLRGYLPGDRECNGLVRPRHAAVGDAGAAEVVELRGLAEPV